MTAALEELSERGQAIYDKQLKASLEPAHNGEVVAIHVDTSEYALGRNSQEAMREIRTRHPEGRLVILTVGSEPDYALATRYLAGNRQAYLSPL